jgi:arylsulfatase A-like enzyme
MSTSVRCTGRRALVWGAALLTAAPVLAQVVPATPRPAPEGAPNVVIVLLDDVGFGATSTFGGAASTPTLDALAKQGLRYNRFHTTAICSPTRASLLTGRNPHATGIGAVENSTDARPGYSGIHGRDTASIVEVLRANGYSTAMFGKWHQTPDYEVSPAGPFNRWPTREGFDTFFGFQGGETDQFEPTLVEGTTPILRRPGPDYHLTEDLAERSIAWLRTQHSVSPGKPFLLYLAPGGIHAPLQVPDEWIARYRGRFDQGWDRLREETLARQKSLGVVPPDTELTARPPGLSAWDDLGADQKKIAARLMETYAAFLAHTDAQVGRVVQALKDSGQFENTLLFYIAGDNGASAEGGIGGSLNYMGTLQGLPEPDALKLSRLAEIGGPETYPHVNAAWAWATNAPLRWTKTVASHLGGTRNGLVITWPKRIADRGGIRSQFGHVNDIAPTILEAAGIAMPKTVDGVAQRKLDGTSLVYSFADANAPERHTTQYFEIFGHRAIYHDGWMASAFHTRLPWGVGIGRDTKPFDEDTWELYDLRRDFSQARDLAAQEPRRLAAMKALFEKEALANQVLPLRGQVASGEGLPDPMKGVTRAVYHPGAVGIAEKLVPRMTNRSWSLSADLEVGDETAGVVATIGGTAAGWSLYLDERRRPTFQYRLFDLARVTLAGRRALPAGRHALRVDFDYDGGGHAKGGTLRLSVDGEPAGEAKLPASPPAFFSINETFDVGLDTGSPAGRYPKDSAIGFPFAGGTIGQVAIELR